MNQYPSANVKAPVHFTYPIKWFGQRTTKTQLKTKTPNMKNEIIFAAKHGLNALLIGKHGTGKSSLPREVFEELNMPYVHLYAPTMDPFMDLVGLPIVEGGKVHFVKTVNIKWEEMQGIIIDEPNRAHKKIINCLYELIQFRSVNQVQVPNLKCVIACMNPPDDYMVESMDESFMDRFHMRINVVPALHVPTLLKYVDEEKAKAIIEWWQSIPENIRSSVSPRRVEYALQYMKHGGEFIDNIIPSNASSPKLLRIFKGEKLPEIKQDLSGEYSLDDSVRFLDNYLLSKSTDNISLFLKVKPESLQTYFSLNFPKGSAERRNKQSVQRNIVRLLTARAVIGNDPIDFWKLCLDRFKHCDNFWICVFFASAGIYEPLGASFAALHQNVNIVQKILMKNQNLLDQARTAATKYQLI